MSDVPLWQTVTTPKDSLSRETFLPNVSSYEQAKNERMNQPLVPGQDQVERQTRIFQAHQLPSSQSGVRPFHHKLTFIAH
jgi:hypothetical protein